MFETRRQRLERQESELAEEREELLKLSEKELLVEILLELKRIDNNLTHVEKTVKVFNV